MFEQFFPKLYMHNGVNFLLERWSVHDINQIESHPTKDIWLVMPVLFILYSLCSIYMSDVSFPTIIQNHVSLSRIPWTYFYRIVPKKRTCLNKCGPGLLSFGRHNSGSTQPIWPKCPPHEAGVFKSLECQFHWNWIRVRARFLPLCSACLFCTIWYVIKL